MANYNNSFLNHSIDELLETAMRIAVKAGEEILSIYNSYNNELDYKQDDSPLTKADTAANKINVWK